MKPRILCLLSIASVLLSLVAAFLPWVKVFVQPIHYGADPREAIANLINLTDGGCEITIESVESPAAERVLNLWISFGAISFLIQIGMGFIFIVIYSARKRLGISKTVLLAILASALIFCWLTFFSGTTMCDFYFVIQDGEFIGGNGVILLNVLEVVWSSIIVSVVSSLLGLVAVVGGLCLKDW